MKTDSGSTIRIGLGAAMLAGVMGVMLPRALLLDLDDTIVTFSAGPRDFWREALQTHWTRPEPSPDELQAAIVEAGSEYWSEPRRAFEGRQDLLKARTTVVLEAFQKLGLTDDATAASIAEYYTREKEEAVAPFPGAIETLIELKRRGLRLALVTNGHPRDQYRKLQRYDLVKLFDGIVVEGGWGVGKPDPSIFREALRLISSSTEETWMVGDNLSADIDGAKKVGLYAVWHDAHATGLPADAPARPDRIVRGLAELLR